MGIGKTLAYMGLWSIGYIAIHTITAPTMKKVQNFVGGSE